MIDIKYQKRRIGDSIDLTSQTSLEIDTQTDNSKKLQEDCIKLQILLEEKKNEVNMKNREIIELKQRIISLEEENTRFLSNQNDMIYRKIEEIKSNLNSNIEKIVNNSVEKSFTQNYKEISEIIQVNTNECISILKEQNNLDNIDVIKKKFDELSITIKSSFKENIIESSCHKIMEENISKLIKNELNKIREETDNFQRGIEKLKLEKNELIACLDKELKNTEKDISSYQQALELYKSKFDNARLVLKNIFTNYLDQEFFQPLIEKCFLNKDLNVEEVSSLSKAIKVNMVVKMYYFILNDVINQKIMNKRGFEDIYNELASLDLDFNSKEELYKFTEKIKIDETNILNRIFSQILKLYDEKCVECQISLDKHVSNKYQIINLLKEKEDLLKTIEYLKELAPKLEETKQNDNEAQINDQIETDPIQVLSERNEVLEKENLILQAQKNELKEQTKEFLVKVKNDLKEIEFMVDKRIITNFVLKALDKSTQKKIRLTVIDTLANFLGFNNDERKKIGLNANLGNNPYYTPSSNEKAREISEELYNYVLNV